MFFYIPSKGELEAIARQVKERQKQEREKFERARAKAEERRQIELAIHESRTTTKH